MSVGLGFCKILAVSLITITLTIITLQIPRYTGTLSVTREGYNSISIERDQFGIPAVISETFEDVAYGIGYAHAQDRLWSMQFKRKVGQGRISEIGGKETLRTDILFRQLKIDQSAQEKYQLLPENIKNVLQSYANGINDYVKSLSVLPLEFILAGSEFEPWQPHDSLALINMMGFFMALEIVYEPSRQQLFERYGEEMADSIFAKRSEFNFELTTVMNDADLIKMGLFQNKTQANSTENEANATIEDNVEVDPQFIKAVLDDDVVEMLDGVVKGIKGSNAWVIHGNHTATGKPLLANDPHLETMIPSVWYQAELVWKQNGKRKQIKGATMPGLPFVMIGRHDYMAWGITNNIIDNSDYYVEVLNLKNSTYLYDNEWLPLAESKQVIKVKNDVDFVFTQHSTLHGPIIEGLFHLMNPKDYHGMDHLVSLKWTGHILNDRTMEGLYNLMFVQSIEEIESQLYLLTVTNLNIVYATVDNHIGYYAQGRFPVKHNPKHHHFHNGTNSHSEWIRYYTQEEQPRVVDPEKGFIVSANNKIATDNLIHNINAGQTSIPRARRISDLLEKGIAEGKKFKTEDFLKMQMDSLDVYASYIVAPILKIYDGIAQKFLNETERAQYKPYLQYLREWDFRMAKDSIGASVYISWEHFFLRSFLHELTDNEAKRSVINMSYMFDHYVMNLIVEIEKSIEEGKLEPNLKSICKIPQLNEAGDCIENLILSFKNGFAYLETTYGTSVENWKWGKIHRHRFDHKPFSGTPLKSFWERSYVGEGNRRTINVGGVNHLPGNWDSWYSPNYRQVIDLSEDNHSFFVLDTGISETPFSKHYDDQMKLHETGNSISMKFRSEKKVKPTSTLEITFNNSQSCTKTKNNKCEL